MSLNNQIGDITQKRVADRNAMSNDPQPSYELVHLMTDYASRYGFLLGGLEMVAEGHATADAVLEAFRKKYEQPKPDTVTKPLP